MLIFATYFIRYFMRIYVNYLEKDTQIQQNIIVYYLNAQILFIPLYNFNYTTIEMPLFFSFGVIILQFHWEVVITDLFQIVYDSLARLQQNQRA